MANHINKLTDIYNRWLSKDENKNVSKGSADDVLYDDLFKNSLTKEQKEYLTRFCDIWEEAQEHDVCLSHLIEERKEEQERAKQDALHDIRKDEDYANQTRK